MSLCLAANLSQLSSSSLLCSLHLLALKTVDALPIQAPVPLLRSFCPANATLPVRLALCAPMTPG